MLVSLPLSPPRARPELLFTVNSTAAFSALLSKPTISFSKRVPIRDMNVRDYIQYGVHSSGSSGVMYRA